jgi:hypothetical protein
MVTGFFLKHLDGCRVLGGCSVLGGCGVLDDCGVLGGCALGGELLTVLNTWIVLSVKSFSTI